MLAKLRFSVVSFVVSASLAGVALGQTQFAPTGEAWDGPVQDLAGPSLSSANDPETQRVWVASGRVRVALRVSDRARMEVETFDEFDNPRKELVLAVELNEARGELFTLTDSGIYREDVSTPADPTQIQELAFEDFQTVECSPQCIVHAFPLEFDEGSLRWEMDEDILDIKVWEGATAFDDRLVLMTAKRIIILHVPPAPFGMTVQSFANELFSSTSDPHVFLPSTFPGTTFNAAKLASLRKMRLVDDGGKAMAYLIVSSNQFAQSGVPGVPGVRRDVHAFVACDLDSDSMTPFENPTFNASPTPATDIEYRWWEPNWPVTWPTGFPDAATVRQHTIFDFDLYSDSNDRYAILGCGCNEQLVRLDITNAFASQPSEFLASTTIDGVTSSAGSCGAGASHLYGVRADPATTHRYFVASAEEFHVVDDSMAPRIVSTTVDEPMSPTPGLNRPAKRDMVVMKTSNDLYLELSPPETAPLPPYPVDDWAVWTGIYKATVDHNLKIFGVTANTAPMPLQLFDEGYLMNASDGAVAIPEAWDVCTPTFGGIVRFHSTDQGQTWSAVQESYQPAEYEVTPGGDRVQRGTEHIDIGDLQTLVDPHRIFTVSGQGEVFRFRVDSNTGNPLGASVFEPQGTIGPWGTYTSSGNVGFYSNDVAFVDLNPGHPTNNKYALTIVTRKATGAPTFDTEHGLLVYQWDGASSWDHIDIAVSQPITHTPKTTNNANSINIAEAHGTTWAFVGHQEGFFWVDLAPLLTGGSLTSPVPIHQGLEFSPQNQVDVGCVLALEDPTAGETRLFISKDVRKQFEIYVWNDPTVPLNHVLNDPNLPAGEYTASDPIWNGLLTMFPNATRGRYHEYPAPTGDGVRGLIHLAALPYFLQLSWPARVQGGGLDHSAFEFVGYWEGDYSSTLQDCRAYDFGTGGDNWHVLVSKDTESFAIVPFDGDPNNP